MTISQNTRRSIIIALLAIFLALTIWFSWRLFRVPEVSLTGILPPGQVASIRISDLRGLIDDAKSDEFLNTAMWSPLAQDFERSDTWRLWIYQKQQLESALQSQIDERYLKEALGKYALIALYPGEQFLVTSIVSPLARLQILWSEWTDLFRGHYDITAEKRQGVRVATLSTSGGTFYYMLIGRFGLLASDAALFESAFERYRATPSPEPSERMTTYVDFTRLPPELPYADLAHRLPVRSWRSQTHWEQDRWVSLHRFSLTAPLQPAPSADLPLGTATPRDAVLAGFVRLSPEWLWRMLRPYVGVQSPRPVLGPYLEPGISFSLQATDHLLPGLTLSLPTRDPGGLAEALQELHGKVRLLEKPIRVSRATSYLGRDLFPLSWSPALLVRVQGGYALSGSSLLFGNDREELKQHLDAMQGNLETLDRLSDLQDSDGALWLRPEGLPPILKQSTRIVSLASMLSSLSLPWLQSLNNSGDIFQHLSEIRASWKIEGDMLTLRIEIAPTPR